ncbi:hypothetical protein [Paludisphaera rhizosphaerae]|uniref:hypothetical protein n=1 Tax=Paludisphaera rhizosphaerae TaxID=2711216 RepID=UPI0013EC08FE|nr:hypothetical protein [Paludisphaera rhizosphaerae]
MDKRGLGLWTNLRSLMATVLIVALAAAALRAARTAAVPGPRWDPSGPIMSIEPPESARFADPYDQDSPGAK